MTPMKKARPVPAGCDDISIHIEILSVYLSTNMGDLSRDTNLYEVRGHQPLRFSMVLIYPFCLCYYRSFILYETCR